MASCDRDAAAPDSAFDFDAFSLETEGKGAHATKFLSLCKSVGVHTHICQSDAKLMGFFADVASRMRANAFHNLTHVVDVTQCCCTILRQTNLLEWFPPHFVVGLFFAAVCHDLDHPGTSNALQINENTEFALKYKHDCPLEHHHYACAKELLSKHAMFGKMKPKDIEAAGRMVELIILSTDMGKHKRVTDEFSSLLDTAAKAGTEIHNDDKLCVGIVQLIIKASDISNQARPLDIAWKWNIAVYTEFYAEGDQDRAAGRKLNPLYDRSTNVIAGSTVGFIKFVVRPLFTLLQRSVETLRAVGVDVDSTALAQPLLHLDANIVANSEKAKDALPGLPHEITSAKPQKS